MTLSRQLLMLIVVLVLLLFAGTLTISINNMRGYLETQLGSHAQDAATSLGLSATSHVDQGDQAMVTTMVNAMFHRGDYLSIRFEDLEGHAWLERRTEVQLDQVPAWFTRMFALAAPQREATMMSGWRQVGRVSVTSHPGLAYEKLWQTTLQTAKLFVVGALLALLVGIVGLRLLLQPLRDVEAQARAICNREFPVVERRPFTLELRRVVEAMNRLSGRVSRMLSDAESLATELRSQAYQDPLTGLANRRQFMDVLEHRTSDSEVLAGGGLLLLQLRDFKAYNQQSGYAAGDRLLKAAGKAVADAVDAQPGCTVAHLSGADFAVLIENVDRARMRELAGAIDTAVAALYGSLQLPSPDVSHIGGAMYCGQAATDLLADADMALRQAQREGANSIVIHQCKDDDDMVRGGTQWRELIEGALTQGMFDVLLQPVVIDTTDNVMHHEAFVRVADPARPGKDIAAATLLPMAESNGLAADVDRAVVQRVLDDLMSGRVTGRVAVNLSPVSLVAPDMLDWLDQQLGYQPALAERLVLEFPEYGAAAQAGPLTAWVERLGARGVEFSLDHFGKGFSSFSYLRAVKVDYVKVDGSLTRQLREHDDNRFLLRTMIEVAHSLDIRVIAEAVEDERDWQILRSLGVDGGRGYLFGRPARIAD